MRLYVGRRMDPGGYIWDEMRFWARAWRLGRAFIYLIPKAQFLRESAKPSSSKTAEDPASIPRSRHD